MKFANAMQMKAYMKMEANKLSVTSAAPLQNYMLERLWKVYQKEYVYAEEISFADLIDTLHEFSSSIGILSLPE